MHNKLYFISEGIESGLIQYNVENNNYNKIIKDVSGFYIYADTTENFFYYGSCDNGLYITKFSELNKPQPNWQIINKQQGLNLTNILTITKDKIGRIWTGQVNRGWAVYYPKTKKVKTYLIENKQTNFGTISSYTDSKGTVWLGTKQQGLLFYNDYSTDTVNPNLIKHINHPLLPNNKTITSMVQNGNWLIMGVTNYYVAFDLATWYATGKVLVKYLNPHEAAFTSETEQNTLLVDKRDSSVWFSTNDMLYQWDFKTWLSLPIYIANPNINISYSSTDTSLTNNKVFYLQPTNNTIQLQVWFQTKDNMPRYMAIAFGKVSDSLVFDNITLNTHYTFSNLASGNYVFKLLICQSDGNVSYHNYYITINKFWWQHWWVWLLFSLAIFSPLLLWLNAKRKTAIQNKQLANMQLVALGNQFKPHFTLNALNSIGAAIRNNSTAEIVLDKLSNANRIVFDQMKRNSITHTLQQEWELIENIIAISKTMYLPQLEFIHTDTLKIECFNTIVLPMGLLQIHIENALQHGLEHKTHSPYILEIKLKEDEQYLHINIIDNGIGRKKSAQLSTNKNNGVGIKNLQQIIDVFNKHNHQKIEINIKDNVFANTNNEAHFEGFGTEVIIIIPKKYDYNIS